MIKSKCEVVCSTDVGKTPWKHTFTNSAAEMSLHSKSITLHK